MRGSALTRLRAWPAAAALVLGACAAPVLGACAPFLAPGGDGPPGSAASPPAATVPDEHGADPGSGATPGQSPAPEPAPTPTPPPPGELAGRFRTAFSALPGYELSLTYYQRQGDQDERGAHDVRGRPPRDMLILPTAGRGEGYRILWTGGGPRARVRLAGLLSWQILELALDDPQLASIRGYTFAQSDLGALDTLLADPASTLAPVAGRRAVRVTGPAILPRTEAMTVAFDPQTAIPSVIEAHEGGILVFELAITRFASRADVTLDL